MNGRIRVLELFHEYLNPSENWAFRMIDNVPDCDIVVGAKRFKKCNFYPPRFDYLEFPLRRIEQKTEAPWTRAFNKLVAELTRLYPWYLAQYVGRVDLVHSHFSFVGWQYRNLAKRLGVPHVISFYGYDYENLPFTEPVWKDRYPVLFREADLFVCEGEHGASILKGMGCPPEKIKVARLGVDTRRIPFLLRNKERSELKLLQIASLVPKKGHVYTVKAFVEALKTCPNMTLTIVGKDYDGLKDELLALLDQHKAQDKVTFLDFIDFDTLHQFMSDYHVFIHPSCYTADLDCEGGAPVVLLDAQATGMPVISTTHCDISDEVLHEKTGLLAPEKDVPALASYIERFYDMDESTYHAFCRNGRSHVENRYDTKLNGTLLRDIYSSLLHRNADR